MTDFTKEQLDAKPFALSADPLLTKEEYLAKLASPDRIVAESRWTLNKVDLLVWAFFGGHRGKVWKCAVDGNSKAHPDFHGRLTYHDTSADAKAAYDKVVEDIVKAGGTPVKAIEEVGLEHG